MGEYRSYRDMVAERYNESIYSSTYLEPASKRLNILTKAIKLKIEGFPIFVRYYQRNGGKMKNATKIMVATILFFGFFGLLEHINAATLYMPDTCANFSSCVSAMKSGDTLVIRNGQYGHSTTGVKAGTTIQAENDGKVIFTGSFNPGNAGFTMRGIVVKSNQEKALGAGNKYHRMSFVGGPSCGNAVNSLMGANTEIYQSAFYGQGGRYLLLAYKVNGGVIIQDVIFRPDGGWGAGSSCSGYEPHAAYNMYDSEGFSITRAIVVDGISSAGSSSAA